MPFFPRDIGMGDAVPPCQDKRFGGAIRPSGIDPMSCHIQEREYSRMVSRFTWAVSLLITVSAPAIADTDQCPVLDGKERLELLAHAPTCDKSLALFQACSYGAGGDVGLSEVVVKKCERDFLTRLSAWQRRIYDRKQRRCARKYQNESGTMYRSFEAFCSANLAQAYAHRFTKAANHERNGERPLE